MKKKISMIISLTTIVLLISSCGVSIKSDPYLYSLYSVETGTSAENETEISEEEIAKQAMLEEENNMILSAMEDPFFGLGEKLAVIIEKSDGERQYSFNGLYLPDDLRAQNPDEIGAFLLYSIDNTNENEVVYEITLVHAFKCKEESYDSGDEYGLFNYSFSSNPDCTSLSRYDIGDKADFYKFDTDDISENIDLINIYIEDDLPGLLKLQQQYAMFEFLNNQPQLVEFGEGQNFIGYDEDAGIFTLNRVPEKAMASSMADTGYILAYKSTWGVDTGRYYGSGVVDVSVETFDARILYAYDYSEIATFQIQKSAPNFLKMINGIPAQQKVYDEEIMDAIRDAFNENGIPWPYDSEP